MRFAEVFLRMGSALVVWMVLYAYVLWLAALYKIGCGPDGDELHRLLLGMAVIAMGGSLLLQLTRAFSEVHKMLRWLGVPLLLLMPFALRSVWAMFRTVNLGSSTICSNEGSSTWQLLWAPFQALTLVVVALMLVRVWRSVAKTESK